MRRSERFEVLEKGSVHKDGFVREWPEIGLVAIESTNNPIPTIKVEEGRIIEMDSKKREDFDFIDIFLAEHSIHIENAEKSMAMDSLDIARMMVDINISRDEIVKITTSLTAAKLVEVIDNLNIVEMMMALQKMRARRTPANQACVTNLRDNPIQIAADSAEGALRGFAEMGTKAGILRYTLFNAISILIGSQTGRPGVLTQCLLEDDIKTKLGMLGFASYVETISVYGTESAFVEGDDTPWSKSFLASAYTSKGFKTRFSSSIGSEVQMGCSEGKSMLYLEARCIMMAKGTGVQGLQNGLVNGAGVSAAVPEGIRAILGKSLIIEMLDLEVVSGDEQIFTNSQIRKTSKTMMQFLPGADFVCPGYSSTPSYDNMFTNSNWNAEDYDDWLVLQRDLRIDGGLKPVAEEEVIAVRNRAAKAIQVLFKELGLPSITDEEVEAATYAHGSRDMPARNVEGDLNAIQELLNKGITGLDIVKALHRGGFADIAERILNMFKQRVTGDYLHQSSIFDAKYNVISAINDRNDYMGPGTGYRVEAKRWDELKNINFDLKPHQI
ncbi:propanediol/glycerol family dehydratase large subunit [Clostridium sp. WILCCON 0269]|uniref:Propanediol/glycerol family dehydratase large subunit n=1 Tax=Candidatus Clostridium eludens TaxID=3381663 RepID=A0ABW8SR75_9CLOT